MIKEAENAETIRINVVLKDGTEFLAKDIPAQPLGEHETLVSFWHRGVLRIHPMSEVKYFEFTFEKEA